jgi:regulatory protein YycI of two-component signal transduction system YycFG
MTRNNLKKLEKTIGGVYLYLNKKNKVIEYSTIVDTEDTLAVYTNFYTRNIILK